MCWATRFLVANTWEIKKSWEKIIVEWFVLNDKHLKCQCKMRQQIHRSQKDTYWAQSSPVDSHFTFPQSPHLQGFSLFEPTLAVSTRFLWNRLKLSCTLTLILSRSLDWSGWADENKKSKLRSADMEKTYSRIQRTLFFFFTESELNTVGYDESTS